VKKSEVIVFFKLPPKNTNELDLDQAMVGFELGLPE
jgi:hypothetical protein